MLEADIYCDSTRIFILTVLFFISVRPFNITVKKKVNDTYEQVLKHLHLVVIESRKKGYNTFSLGIRQICIYIIQKSLNIL